MSWQPATPEARKLGAMIHDRAGGGYDLDLEGFTVTLCCVDRAFTHTLVKPLRFTEKGQKAPAFKRGMNGPLAGEATLQ
jgi:hypothetical protein